MSTENQTPVNHFVELSKVNVSAYTEKKGKFTYLSWTFAVSEAMKADPQTNWVFRDPMTFPDGSMMVHCDVTMFGKTVYMFLPVMNNTNKAIQNPDAFAVNTAMMRCLVKGIAAHGLGLYIYAGEDLPEEEKAQQQEQFQQQQEEQRRNQAKQLEGEYQQALQDIAQATDKQVLLNAWNYFKNTQYAKEIQNAAKAKRDQEGWK